MNFLQGIISVLDDHDWIMTFIVGLFAVLLYMRRRTDNVKDAAKLILQEIRYSDQKIRNYRTYNSYNFTEKILPTNSWNKNINLFVRRLSESELDLISKFFSSAAYLDEVIESIAKIRNKDWIQADTPSVVEGEQPAMGTGALADESTKKLIEAISKDIESIYNTPAADKLRTIAERKWYQIF